jgi:hypothetical protein
MKQDKYENLESLEPRLRKQKRSTEITRNVFGKNYVVGEPYCLSFYPSGLFLMMHFLKQGCYTIIRLKFCVALHHGINILDSIFINGRRRFRIYLALCLTPPGLLLCGRLNNKIKRLIAIQYSVEKILIAKSIISCFNSKFFTFPYFTSADNLCRNTKALRN